MSKLVKSKEYTKHKKSLNIALNKLIILERLGLNGGNGAFDTSPIGKGKPMGDCAECSFNLGVRAGVVFVDSARCGPGRVIVPLQSGDETGKAVFAERPESLHTGRLGAAAI